MGVINCSISETFLMSYGLDTVFFFFLLYDQCKNEHCFKNHSSVYVLWNLIVKISKGTNSAVMSKQPEKFLVN